VLALVYKAVTPPSTLMLARWLTGQPVVRQVVPLDQISPDLRLAVVASEDAKFCLHGGVDWDALWDVIDDEDSPSRGASTITMQTTKNVFLWGGRSYLRKAIEIPLALVVDAVWGKRRTLEVYLNLAEWGDGIFGAEAAARHWFHRSARDLTRAQATLLAVSLPNPHLRKAGQPTVRVRGLAGRLVGRMNGAAPFAGCIR
jgi:monofunctional biosynthetic peptidoglycan transglycosylase